MPRDGAGNYSLPQPAFQPNTVISSSAVNSDFSDVASALTGSLAANGETPVTANLPMSGFRHTSVSNATARNQYAAAAQVQDGALVFGGVTGGTSSAFTATVTPGVTVLVDGMAIRIRAHVTCIANPTLNLNALGAKKIYVGGTVQARAGDIVGGSSYELIYNTALDSGAGGWVQVGGSVGALAGRGTQLFMGAPQSIPNNTVTALTGWTGTVGDTLGAWSAGTPSRLTVPAGVELVMVVLNSVWSYVGSTGSVTVSVAKNGSLDRGTDTRATFNGSGATVTRVDPCIAGDYYEAFVFQNTGGAVNWVGAGNGAFSIVALR